jgi:hypothetical protein
MEPKVDFEALDLGPQRELSHADLAVCMAALGTSSSIRIATKLRSYCYKGVESAIQRVESSSKAITNKFSNFGEA